ncbi:MAG TPA: hypothetical protein VMT23_03930 [Candidatus Binatia bacterium]|nr:hypothetical protein [Candidatus Binatia bacterium]
MVWPTKKDGTLDTLSPVSRDIEVVSSSDEFFEQPGQLDEEVRMIRDRGDQPFPWRRDIVSLGLIEYQRPRQVRLGRVGVLHLESWKTVQAWPLEAGPDMQVESSVSL